MASVFRVVLAGASLAIASLAVAATTVPDAGTAVVAIPAGPEPGAASSPDVARKIELSDALELAARRIPDGTIVDADLKSRDGRDAWDVEMLQGGERVRVWVDAADGTVKVLREASR